MTTREYFQNVLNSHISEEMDNYSTDAISKLDARNEKRKTTPSKASVAVAERAAAIAEFFAAHTDEEFTRDNIAAALNITPGQVTAGVKGLVTSGAVKREKKKIDKADKIVYTMPKIS